MPPKRTKKAQNSAEQEGRIQLAVQALKKDEISTIREAARLFNVSESTLRRRRAGVKARVDLRANSHKLTNNEEISLVQWIVSMDDRGSAPGRSMVADMANILLAERDETPVQTVGANWATNFVKRHPTLLSLYSKLNPSGSTNSVFPPKTPENLSTHYTRPRHSGSANSVFSPKTPQNVSQLQEQVSSIKVLMKEHSESPPTPQGDNINQMIEALELTIEAVIFLSQKYGVSRSENEKKRSESPLTHKDRALNKLVNKFIKGIVFMASSSLSVAHEHIILRAEVKALDAIPEVVEADILPLGEAPAAPLQQRIRALPTCSDCGVKGHKRTSCLNRHE
ncbi:hypothetical protein N7520_009894 [Penicillium odoratum]|uniref:uncharacterized protein n=1 Tax=Penicillium odoratum TaxID=1167516 RepID=UPI0025473963|nr:uncharacterized protein N7520_009894 [Penicillium odoratum]KAJ5752977.1 hypothetical protein N7520_009894 [Penicillium odoratum]